MVSHGTFDPPVIPQRYASYPAVGDGTLEITDGTLRITARALALQWLSSLLGILGFVVGLASVILSATAGLPNLVYMVIWSAPAIGGVAAGHVLGRRAARKRGPIVRELLLARVHGASLAGDTCEILVKVGWYNRFLLRFVPADRADLEPLLAALPHKR